MKYILYLTAALIAAIIYACAPSSNHKRIGENVFQIDPDGNDEVSIHDIFAEIEIIPLETTDNSLISDIEREIVEDGKFYLLDKKQQTIFIFDAENGKFLKKIHKLGQGPNDYLYVDDFNINRFTKKIEILSAFGSFYIYDPDGEMLLEKFRIPFPDNITATHHFHHLTADIYVFLTETGQGEMFFYSKKDNKIVSRGKYLLPEIISGTIFSPSRNPFYVYNDTLCFQQQYNGDVFTISPQNYELKPRYFWDFGIHNFNLSFIPKLDMPHIQKIEYISGELTKRLSMDYVMLSLTNQENSNYYITEFEFYKNRRHYLIFNKKTGKYFFFEKFKDANYSILPDWIDESYMYAIIPPYVLHKHVDPSMLNEENQLKLQQIKDDDNPVIIKYKFKL